MTINCATPQARCILHRTNLPNILVVSYTAVYKQRAVLIHCVKGSRCLNISTCIKLSPTCYVKLQTSLVYKTNQLVEPCILTPNDSQNIHLLVSLTAQKIYLEHTNVCDQVKRKPSLISDYRSFEPIFVFPVKDVRGEFWINK